MLAIGVSDRLELLPVERQDRIASVVRLSLVQGGDLSATIDRAYLIPEMREAFGFVEFLEELSSLHWKGWSGTRDWSSLEGTLTLAATWHRTGGAKLSVRLRSEGETWEARGTIEVDNMALEKVGPTARAVLLGDAE